MNGERYSDGDITRYLLGSLPADETERLDELSISDDHFAGRLQAVEDDLVDAYVRGELSGQTLEGFKSFYLSSSQTRRQKVRFAEVLREVAERPVVAGTREDERYPVEGSSTSWRERGAKKHRFLFTTRPALQWGLVAATFLVVVVGGWFALETARLRDRISATQAEQTALRQRERELESQLNEHQSSISEKEQELARLRERLDQLARRPASGGTQLAPAEVPSIVSFFLTAPTRGVARVPEVPVPPDADYVALQLEVEAADYPFYRVEVRQPGGATVWQSDRLRTQVRRDAKFIAVTVRASLLKPQRYDLVVYGISAAGDREAIGTYPITVARQ